MKRLRGKHFAGLLAKDFFKALVFTAVLYGLHADLEEKPSGRYLRQFEFELLQESLNSAPPDDATYKFGGKNLPLVVDISELHPDKNKRSDREMLDMVVTRLQEASASAIGIDLDFADDRDDVDNNEYRYLAKWNDYKIVRVGVYARATTRKTEWLGGSELARMAAGIALPKEDAQPGDLPRPDPKHALLYSRVWHPRRPKSTEEWKAWNSECKTPDGNNCRESLPGLPFAMWQVTHCELEGRPDEAHCKSDGDSDGEPVAKPDVPPRQVRKWLDLGEYPVDYSYLTDLMHECITLKHMPRNQAADEGITRDEIRAALPAKTIRNRSVLIADLHDASDQFCYTAANEPVPGALVHACALASLNRGLFTEVTKPTFLELLMIFSVLIVMMLIRLFHTFFRPVHSWDYQYIEILAFTAMSFVTYSVFVLQIRRFGEVWPDCLWVCAALFIHPFLTDPFWQTCKGLAKAGRDFVITFAASGPGGKDDR
jgi:hypothetical protein